MRFVLGRHLIGPSNPGNLALASAHPLDSRSPTTTNDSRCAGEIVDAGNSEVAGQAPNSDRWHGAAESFIAWQQGNSEALAPLVYQVSPALWHIARAAGLDAETAEDVVQSTWLTLVRTGSTIENPQAVVGWLFTTTRREAWRLSRNLRREPVAEQATIEAALPSAEGPEERVLLSAEQATVWRCLNRLSERCRGLLRAVAAKPRPDYAEVSKSLDMPLGSIGPTRSRCLAKLREELLREDAL